MISSSELLQHVMNGVMMIIDVTGQLSIAVVPVSKSQHTMFPYAPAKTFAERGS